MCIAQLSSIVGVRTGQDKPGTSMARQEKPASTRPGMIGDQKEWAPPRPWMKKRVRPALLAGFHE